MEEVVRPKSRGRTFAGWKSDSEYLNEVTLLCTEVSFDLFADVYAIYFILLFGKLTDRNFSIWSVRGLFDFRLNLFLVLLCCL